MNDSDFIFIEGIKSVDGTYKNVIDITNVHIFNNKRSVLTYSCSQFLEKISEVLGVKIEYTDDKNQLEKLSNFIGCSYYDTQWSVNLPNNEGILFGVIKKVGDTNFTVHTY